jgi:hypothetical protein
VGLIRLTLELTGRGHNADTDKFSMKAALFALRLNDLLGGAGKRGVLSPPVMKSVAFSVSVLTRHSDAQNGFPLFR